MYATNEELIRVRERVAKLEGGHDTLHDSFNLLSNRVEKINNDLNAQIVTQAGETRRELMTHMSNTFSDLDTKQSENTKTLEQIRGGIKILSWMVITFLTLITGLLGWSQFGDLIWGYVKCF